MMRIGVGLGSNLGDRRANLEAAIGALSKLGTEIRLASLYETPPIGPPQPDYLNSAISFRTDLSPEAVLAAALGIERSLGRVRGERWGPRTLDLDLLAGLDERARPLAIEAPGLTIPHPELSRRGFALVPLLEVLAELTPRYRLARATLQAARPVLPIEGPLPDGKGWTRTSGLR